MNTQRHSRRTVSNCPEIINIFNGHPPNPDLAHHIPLPIFREIGSRSNLTCSTILNCRELMPTGNLEEEYQLMQLATKNQTSEHWINA